MQSSTYKDIIDDKIAEWKNSLKILEEKTGTATGDAKGKLRAKTSQLRSAIAKAEIQLRYLDGQETVENTMETKNKIVKLFTSIDKEFPKFEVKSPFML